MRPGARHTPEADAHRFVGQGGCRGRERRVRRALDRSRAAEDNEQLSSVPNQPLGIAGSERATAAEQEDRLEQRGLAGAVAAPNQIVPGMQFKIGVLDAAEIVYREFQEAQRASPAVMALPLVGAGSTIT
jgi:hypothetical protein